MVTSAKAIFRTNVYAHKGPQKRFEIRPARRDESRLVTDIYRGVLTDLDIGLAVEPEHIESRLAKDPESVHLGLIDGEPASLINVVKRNLPSTKAIPRTHQELTDNETFSSTDPDHGNMWFCPWVAVLKPFRSLKTLVDGAPRSLGQLHVLKVKEEAKRHGSVEHVFAFSRPGNLKKFVEQKLGTSIRYTPLPEQGSARMNLNKEGHFLYTMESGVYLSHPEGTGLVISIPHYWDLTDEKGRRIDYVFDFHASNGAYLLPELVMPYGHIFDATSLGYRTVLEYPM
ncbi:MAG: hypothetical protein ABIH22_03645 [Candidatus Margulisiibacteriota bacterium]